MSGVWDSTPPVPNGVKYAPNFSQYAENEIRKATNNVFQSDYIPEQAQVREWLTSVRSSLQPCPYWRERNIIIAEILRPTFEESNDNWYALYFLGQASDSPPIDLRDRNLFSVFKFDRWLEAVPDYLKELVLRIYDVFQHQTPPNSD
jgi:hypothetical protein